MQEVKFPEIPTGKRKTIFLDGPNYVLIAETKKVVYFYRWDGFSKNYREVTMYEKAKQK